ncbi:MAG: hypothetical protein PUB43_09205 [Oscillospiraceae bacterium]|nr:hypothetical protein [Oscillospiraceae bacterium]
MILEDVAAIRTGVVTTRKKAVEKDSVIYEYGLLNLKCAATAGYLDLQYIETLGTVEPLKPEYFTQMDDILVRLSTPYTVIMITKEDWCGYLVPSHFAIIRVNKEVASPEYILWLLKRKSTKQKILQNISGTGAFGTINSKFFNSLPVRDLPLNKQRIIGQLQILSEKEQELLHKLTAQKEIYNRLLVDKIYDSVKRGN